MSGELFTPRPKSEPWFGSLAAWKLFFEMIRTFGTNRRCSIMLVLAGDLQRPAAYGGESIVTHRERASIWVGGERERERFVLVVP